jgi:hypothetical protein
MERLEYPLEQCRTDIGLRLEHRGRHVHSCPADVELPLELVLWLENEAFHSLAAFVIQLTGYDYQRPYHGSSGVCLASHDKHTYDHYDAIHTSHS